MDFADWWAEMDVEQDVRGELCALGGFDFVDADIDKLDDLVDKVKKLMNDAFTVSKRLA